MKKNIGYALPIWSGSALLLAHVSAAWRNQGIRLTSYFMQAVTCAVALSSGTLSAPFSLPLASALAAGSLGVFGISQYRWSRHHLPDQTHSFFFARVDRKDHTAVVLLACGPLGGYGLGQVILHQVLAQVRRSCSSLRSAC